MADSALPAVEKLAIGSAGDAIPAPAAGAESSAASGAPKSAKEGGKGRGRGEETIDVQFSKALSYILRHGAEKEGLPIRPDGYIPVERVLARPKISKLRFPPREGDKGKGKGKGRAPDLQDILDCVASNSKKRFELHQEGESAGPMGEGMLIRAVQGHSLTKVTELSHVPLTLDNIAEHLPAAGDSGAAGASSSTHPKYVLLHGTDPVAWSKIQQSGGLLTMKRNHVHLAKRRPEAQAVPDAAGGEDGQKTLEAVSGMRSSSKVIIYVDVVRAMKEGGVEFGVASNGAVLTAGLPYTAPVAAAPEVESQPAPSAGTEGGAPRERRPRGPKKGGQQQQKQGILPLKFIARVEDKAGKVIWTPADA